MSRIRRGRFFTPRLLNISALEPLWTQPGLNQFGASPELNCQDPIYPDGRIPKELAALWRSLVRHGGVQAEGIFRVAANKKDVTKTRRALQGGMHFSVDEMSQLCKNEHLAGALIKMHFRDLSPKLLDGVDLSGLQV